MHVRLAYFYIILISLFFFREIANTHTDMNNKDKDKGHTNSQTHGQRDTQFICCLATENDN